LNDESGATVVEYGIIITVLSLVIIGGIGLVADQLQIQWGSNNGAIATAMNKV
jgi:pilus assembly protein Flp/PilA